MENSEDSAKSNLLILKKAKQWNKVRLTIGLLKDIP